jgi:hydrogenase expression/formation protein HypE|uniref:Hydrogenase expression/formation protein HypE n=1 Tax=candidate division WOR-3 bacterium TaxID=2052148 RepID=A0A7V3RIL5_UNCW3
MKGNFITLSHGSGGLLTNKLIKELILKYFPDPVLKKLEDSAELNMKEKRVAFTTDSYVINPIFFPGGDIGKLAICGTINDLAVKGSVPEYISFSIIIEEGLDFIELERILRSSANVAKRAGVRIVCGDTKVVEKGKADKIFITTSGIGTIKKKLAKEFIKPNDLIIISGTIGEHGIAIMNERLNLNLKADFKSDCAPLNLVTNKIFERDFDIHFMRDPTRGGVVGILNEAIEGSNLGIVLEESCLPIRPEVKGACEILGLDPLYIANEGKFIAFVPPSSADALLKFLKKFKLTRNARIIGGVTKRLKGVWLKTEIGGMRPLLLLEAEGLPRIC